MESKQNTATQFTLCQGFLRDFILRVKSALYYQFINRKRGGREKESIIRKVQLCKKVIYN